nr:macrophage mannose receptor 1 [Nothobranchius furzeri]
MQIMFGIKLHVRHQSHSAPPESRSEEAERREPGKMEKVLLIFSVASALCAVSTVPQRNYHFIYQAKNWTEAQRYCRENFIDLATVADVKDVATLNKLANLNQMFASSNAYDAWIGLYNDLNSWRWSMSDPSFYQQNENFRNWFFVQPDNHGGDEACAVINGIVGGWADVPCSQNSTSVCMDVSGMDATFYPISIRMNQTQAQSYCREHHTDLASVRNSMENQGLVKLIAPSISWFGLYRNNWMWSDDSTFSFTYWNTPNAEPSGGKQSCVAANFRSSGLWEDWMCDIKKIFICYSGK